MSSMDWVDEQEKKNEENRGKGYFNIEEGDNRFVLLSHVARLAQVYDPSTKKYRPAEEGDTNVSIKGVCWVYQEKVIKQAKLPYTVVKDIRALQNNPDWEFALPFPHVLTLNAKGAKTKEVVYSLTPSPKKVEIPKEILEELSKKMSPDELVERIKTGKKDAVEDTREAPTPDYPQEDINPEDIPF